MPPKIHRWHSARRSHEAFRWNVGELVDVDVIFVAKEKTVEPRQTGWDGHGMYIWLMGRPLH